MEGLPRPTHTRPRTRTRAPRPRTRRVLFSDAAPAEMLHNVVFVCVLLESNVRRKQG